MINILFSILFIALLLMTNFLVNQRKLLSHLKEQCAVLTKSIEQINKDYPLLVNADLVFAKQLREINVQLVSMDNQIQDLENKRDNDGGYQHALRILEMGGNREEIIDNCHLSSAEAELLMNLQAYRSALKVG
jgi:hypothetical protein